MNNAKVVISGTGLYTPKDQISNDELVAAFNAYVQRYNDSNSAAIEAGTCEPLAESSSEFIVKASGILSRYVVDKAGVLDIDVMHPVLSERDNAENSLQCDMAVAAAEQALKNAGKTAADVDLVICACSNMQRPYPSIAVEIQNALGCSGAAYDLNVACSSATFGIEAAYNSILSGQSKCVLMVNPEICSGHLNFRDRDSHFIFGDACTAVIIESRETCTVNDAFAILGCRLLTKYSNNIRNNFGFLNRTCPETKDNLDKLFIQNGRKVFKEVIPIVVNLIQQHLSDLQIPVADLKCLWLHQANLNMNRLIAEKVLGTNPQPEQAPVILDEYANTSSAGSVIALHKHRQHLSAGAIGLLCSFGAGYSAGNIMLQKL